MTTRQFKAFQLRLNGYTYEDISRVVGLSEFTLRHYFAPKGKWYKAYQEWSATEIEDIQLVAHSVLIARSQEAAQLLVDLLHSEKPSICLRAAESILDRAGFLPNSEKLKKSSEVSDHGEEYLLALERFAAKRNKI